MAKEFDGVKPLPKEMTGYDCRVCLQLHGPDRDLYEVRTQKDQRRGLQGAEVAVYKILTGEGTVSLRDGSYAHADHDDVEFGMYETFLDNLSPEVKERVGI